MSYELIRRTGQDLRDQYIDLVLSFVNDSLNFSSTWRDSTLINYQLYRGLIDGSGHIHKHNIHIPLIYAIIQADVARKVGATLGTFPYVEFQPRPGEEGYARKQDLLFSTQFDADNGAEKTNDLYLYGDLYGNGIALQGWKKKTQRMRITDVAEAPLSKRRVQVIREETKTLYDAPSWEPIDPLDAFPQAGISRIRNMRGFGHQYVLDIDDCRDLAFRGVFDQGELDRLEQESSNDIVEDTIKASRGGSLFTSQRWLAGSTANPYQRNVLCYDWVGYVPSELAVKGCQFVILTVANEGYLLRCRPFPFFHQEFPYFSCAPSPDPHYFWATSKAEIMRKIQFAANKFTNQTLDLVQMAIDPQWVVSRRAGLDTSNMMSRPGRIWLVDGIPQENWMPLPVNMQGAQWGLQSTNILWRWGQLGTGTIEDTVMGQGQAGGTTAREFVGRQEAVANRLTYEARLCEIGWLEPMAMQQIALNDQLLDMPMQIQQLGESARVDPVTGEEYPPSTLVLMPGDLSYRYRARARGSTSKLSTASKQNGYLQLSQVYQSNPAAASAINWIGWAKLGALIFEMPSARELINTQQQAAAMMEKLAPNQQAGVASPQSDMGLNPMSTISMLAEQGAL